MATRRHDELVQTFWKMVPDRAGQATTLWMEVEEGQREKLNELKRLLHTVKGEAHMLQQMECGNLLERTEHLIGALPDGAEPPPEVGDALFNVFEVLVSLASVAESGESFDTGPLMAQLDLLRAQLLSNGVAEAVPSRQPGSGRLSARPPSVEPRGSGRPNDGNHSGAAPAPAPVPEHTGLSVQEVQPHIHELRRLMGEQSPLAHELREAHRMLRALLAELDPSLTPAQLSERLTKTLGYGWEVERRMARIRTQWSQGEFSLRMAVDTLDDEVRTAAMVAIEGMRPRLLRIARSTASELGKQVQLVIEGNAFVEESVAQKLDVAFVHLIRNAVDHGIEPPAQRAAVGKPEAGTLRASIQLKEGRVRVRFEDDGSGVDLSALRAKLGPAAHGLDDGDVLQTIFEHGTTSRREVTSISGRGVGLDAVAEALDSVGGSIRVQSERGLGTRFDIVVPATTAADMVLPVQAGPFRCAFPSHVVRMMMRAERATETARGNYVRVPVGDGEEMVPVVALADLLGEPTRLRPKMPMIVIEYRGITRALAIDSYESPRPVALEPTAQLACEAPSLIGVAATPDGGVLLVLDPGAIIERTTGHHTATVEARKKSSQAHVLVAEDAPVARELLCGILRSFGLRVTDMPDGRQALAAAMKDPPDLLITDIEMPFMGGLELIEALRKEGQFAALPVLVLSTRDDERTKARARKLEVRGFLSKQKFVEAELRRLIDACLSDS